MRPQAAVCIVDDDAAVRDSLHLLLATRGLLVRCHASGADFLADAARADIGCAVIDLRMPGLNGLELQAELARRRLEIPLVFLTGHGDVPTAVVAMRQGAVDFLEKPAPPERLLETIYRALHRGRAQHETAHRAAQTRARLARLTPREREVLELLVAGATSKEIARRLGVSARTVEVHRAHIASKLETRHMAEIIDLYDQIRRDAGAGDR